MTMLIYRYPCLISVLYQLSMLLILISVIDNSNTRYPLPDIPILAVNAADTDIYYLSSQYEISLMKIPMPDIPIPAVSAADTDIAEIGVPGVSGGLRGFRHAPAHLRPGTIQMVVISRPTEEVQSSPVLQTAPVKLE